MVLFDYEDLLAAALMTTCFYIGDHKLHNVHRQRIIDRFP
jgi:hypothetical protein